MSTGLENIAFKQQKTLKYSNIIEKHRIPQLFAKQFFLKTPKFYVLEKMEINHKAGKNGVDILDLLFNSENGQFSGKIVIKWFSNDQDVERIRLLNKWLRNRFQGRPHISLPKILGFGKNYIIYNYIDGSTVSFSSKHSLKMVSLAGEILATFHSSKQRPIDSERYLLILRRVTDQLPLEKAKKHELYSAGLKLLRDLSGVLGGVYGYGDFHPGNIIISSNGQKGYLIDPEYIESESGADRFEDITNFFFFKALTEYSRTGSISFLDDYILTFLKSYNRLLKASGTSLEEIYGKRTIWKAFYFHLGLNSLINAFSKTKTDVISDLSIKTTIDFCIFVWTMAKLVDNN